MVVSWYQFVWWQLPMALRQALCHDAHGVRTALRLVDANRSASGACTFDQPAV